MAELYLMEEGYRSTTLASLVRAARAQARRYDEANRRQNAHNSRAAKKNAARTGYGSQKMSLRRALVLRKMEEEMPYALSHGVAKRTRHHTGVISEMARR